MVKIREIFESIQGEGPYIGYKQLFVRFCGCNLHCGYCDTEFDIKNSKEYVYLETNGTLPDKLKEVIDFVDYVSADIKLPSCTGLNPLWEEHDKFFEIASQKELFAKMVFDKNVTDEEIKKACDLCVKYDIELVLQPKMNGNTSSVSSDFMQEVLNKSYGKVRLIPQVHKFINVQ